jgi:hypothetical protein
LHRIVCGVQPEKGQMFRQVEVNETVTVQHEYLTDSFSKP